MKYEGVQGLFKGLIPNLIGVAPSRYEFILFNAEKSRSFRAIYFFAYANTKSYLVEKMERETPLIHVTSAAAAGSSSNQI